MAASIVDPDLTPSPPAPPRLAAEIATVALGGALGSSLRFAVSRGASTAGIEGLFATATVNLVGAFLLGLTVGLLEARSPHPLLRPFLTIGVFGSFTTFSTLALENHALLGNIGVGIALGHLTATIFFGLTAFVLGRTAARRLAPPCTEADAIGEGHA